MSIINQMLQDLDRRRASECERSPLPEHVRALPPEQSPLRMLWWAMPVLAAIALGAGAVVHHQLRANSGAAADAQEGRVVSGSIGGAPSVPAAATSASGQAAANGEAEPLGATARLPALLDERIPATSVLTREANPISSKGDTVAHAPRVSAPALPASPPAARAPSVALPPAEVPGSAIPAPQPVAAPTAMVPGAPETAKAPAALSLPLPRIEKRMQAPTPSQIAEADFREAVTLLNAGRLEDAQEKFQSALAHEPAHVGARQALFGLLLNAKQHIEAEQVLEEALQLNPHQAGFAMALARLQVERGEVGGAIQTLQKGASAGARSADYLAFSAALLQRQERHAEAAEHYRAALALAPASGVWWMGLGISLHALNRHAEAQDAYRRAAGSKNLGGELQAFVDQRLRQLQQR